MLSKIETENPDYRLTTAKIQRRFGNAPWLLLF